MYLVIPLIFLLALQTDSVLADTQQSNPSTCSRDPDKTQSRIIWQLDFAAGAESVRDFMSGQGFTFEKELTAGGTIEIFGENDRLILQAPVPAFGLATKRDLPSNPANWLILEWGVDRFPDSADWSQGINREAIMVYLFFGEPRPSDHLFLPATPFYIGHFLGRSEQLFHPFIGKRYRQTGRYVCLATPEPGQEVVSKFHFAEAFRRWFNHQEAPPVSGIAIEVDTTDLPGGSSSAFIKRISLVHSEQEGEPCLPSIR
jgi:hypothetical protein